LLNEPDQSIHQHSEKAIYLMQESIRKRRGKLGHRHCFSIGCLSFFYATRRARLAVVMFISPEAAVAERAVLL
jgi:hypothetical protein